ncbi:MAG: putative manganese transporter, partial [Candidatus Fimimonas sp.]
MWETVLDALIDSAKALPFLLVIYLLIEFLENNQKAKYKTVKLLNGKLAPLVAGGVGLIPQCGFSVMATDLYTQNYLKLGTLIAFFVATSDEALPILLTNGKTVGVVWVVLAIKIVYAVALGYLINLFDKRTLCANFNLQNSKGCCHHDLGGATSHETSNEHEQHGSHKHEENSSHDDVHEHEHEHENSKLSAKQR